MGATTIDSGSLELAVAIVQTDLLGLVSLLFREEPNLEDRILQPPFAAREQKDR